MSRIGKKIINIPDGVTIEVSPTNKVTVKGSKGTLEQQIHSKIKVKVAEGNLEVNVSNPEDKLEKSLWGLSRSLIANMVLGVVEGYKKQLEINGVGFKAVIAGKKLILNIGFSHTVEYEVPEEVEVVVEKNIITITGIDKQKVGQVAAEIRAFKKPEPYKGKGIKYIDEVIRRKAGKVVKAAE